MTTHIALRIAVLCGMVAFGWVLLSNAPPPSPGRPALAPPLPDDPDGLLRWLADGYGDRDPGVWRHAGEIFLWRDEPTAARRAWRQAVRLSRASPQRWGQYTLAWSLARLGDRTAGEHVEVAIEQMRQRESERGASAGSALSRAVLLRVAGQDERAAAELALARLRLDAAGGAADRESLYALARIEAMEGRPDMALAALERAAEAPGRLRRIGRARWALEFGTLRDDPRFRRAIDRLERRAGAGAGGGRGSGLTGT